MTSSLFLARYVLAQQGEWIFQGLLTGEFLEYAVTLCAIFRLFAASEPDDRSLDTLRQLHSQTRSCDIAFKHYIKNKISRVLRCNIVFEHDIKHDIA